MGNLIQSGNSRLWVFEGGASPATTPKYYSRIILNDLSKGEGDVTPVYEPSDESYDKFDEVDQIRGAEERATGSLTGYYNFKKSPLLRLSRLGCYLDLQILFGRCNDPRNYNSAWDKIVVFEEALVTNHNLSSIATLTQDDRNQSEESADVSGVQYYEIVKLQYETVTSVSGTGTVNDGILVLGTEGCQSGDCNESVVVGGETIIISNGANAIFYSTDELTTSGSTSAS